jgi:hypothetical protein
MATGDRQGLLSETKVTWEAYGVILSLAAVVTSYETPAGRMYVLG